MKVTPSRRAAYRVLSSVRERGAYAPEILDSVLREGSLQDSDAAHATRLAYGTLQVSGTLDEVIDRFAHRAGALEPAIRDVLRVGAYELLFGEAAAHAAVHQAVEAVREIRPQAAAMANAVMRRIVGEQDAFPWGDPQADTAAFARSVGHPDWLVERWIEELGRDAAAAVLVADNEPAPLYLRHNPFLGDYASAIEILEEDGARPSACDLDGCIWTATPSAAVNGRAVREGFAVVTDAAAQFATLAADPGPGDTVVEIGAGRGTKTLELQAVAQSKGGLAHILAVDNAPHKVRILEDRAAVLGVPGIESVLTDATIAPLALPSGSFDGEADLVLIDAPCSGLGALRRRPMKRWRVGPDDPARLSVLQSRMLAAAAPVVARGGAIVYSTCTISRVENQEVVGAFLASEAGRDFRTAALEAYVPASWSRWTTEEGWFQSLTSSGGPDGHFVARLERV